jgi:2-dehydro-3-deoxyphosphooctonate aldolase (KDO 8-P synthase)
MTAQDPHSEHELIGRHATIAGHAVGSEAGPFLFAGPCVLESRDAALALASELAAIADRLSVFTVFKASFDKANRTSAGAFRGPGIEEGLRILEDVRDATGLALVTDVHLPRQCAAVGEVVDVLQIPAFLCRQTDLLLAAAATGRAINIKKGQFLAPWDMRHPVEKCRAAGNPNIMVCERGASFGYGRLVVDMSGFDDLARTGAPVVFDATHSVQRPGEGGKTGGDRKLVPSLARAAVATGRVDGLFFEVHPDPKSSPSDAANIVDLAHFESILAGVLAVRSAVRG